MARSKRNTDSEKAQILKKQIEEATQALAALSEKQGKAIGQLALRYQLENVDMDTLEKEFKALAERHIKA